VRNRQTLVLSFPAVEKAIDITVSLGKRRLKARRPIDHNARESACGFGSKPIKLGGPSVERPRNDMPAGDGLQGLGRIQIHGQLVASRQRYPARPARRIAATGRDRRTTLPPKPAPARMVGYESTILPHRHGGSSPRVIVVVQPKLPYLSAEAATLWQLVIGTRPASKATKRSKEPSGPISQSEMIMVLFAHLRGVHVASETSTSGAGEARDRRPSIPHAMMAAITAP